MREKSFLCGIFFLVAAVGASLALGAGDNPRVLEVVGKGAEGRQPYRGGGKVKFIFVSMPASLVHFSGGKEIRAPIEIEYEVLRSAPILLDSRLGSEYWSLYNYTTGATARLHSREGIDLRGRGRRIARATVMTLGVGGSELQEGLCGIRGRSYFLIVDAKTDRWLDVVDPNPFWHSAEVQREMTFTMANLTRFELILDDFQSTWKAGETLRVRLTVKDGDDHTFPVPRAQVAAYAETLAANPPAIPLQAAHDFLNVPLGHFEGRLPEGAAPTGIVVEAKVTAQTASGEVLRTVKHRFVRGQGLVEKLPSDGVAPQAGLARTADGRAIETRAVWVHTRDFATPEAVQATVARIKRANLNVVIPIVYYRGCVMFRTDKLPMEGGVAKGFDPLAHLVEKCHAAGLEVHPWFCVAYLGTKQGDDHGPGFARYPHFAVVGKDGKPFALSGSAVPADMCNPEYQEFVVGIMTDVVRNYAVDGLHFDYIRTMTNCFCQRCRQDFKKTFGHSMEEATDEEWVKWNRDAVGKVVRETSTRARSMRKGIILSAAVFANMESGARQGQDPAAWADSGDLDVILPMDYTMDAFELRMNERKFLEAMRSDEKLATGISLYIRSGAKVSPREASLVIEQIAVVRSVGIRGFCFFAYEYLSDEILEALRTELCCEPALPTFRCR